ncbi:MAG: hypothetical protein H7A33_05875 [Deltaproteobacteria bacterium]|nr:hypothetical protein [Deltaproteobacteria bacterium]
MDEIVSLFKLSLVSKGPVLVWDAPKRGFLFIMVYTIFSGKSLRKKGTATIAVASLFSKAKAEKKRHGYNSRRNTIFHTLLNNEELKMNN